MFGLFSTAEVLLFLLVLGLLIIGIRRLVGRSPKTKAVTHLRFDLINPHAVAYARTHLLEDLGPLKERGREIIRDYVVRSVGGEFAPQKVARLIRDNALALTPEQVIASNVYGKGLLKKRLDSNTINRRLEKFNARQLQDRAEKIARTAIIQAQVEGQRALWREAAKEGTFDRHTATRIWHVSQDEKLCPLCASMDGQEIPFDGTYKRMDDGYVGSSVNVFGEVLDGPVMHLSCRCWEELVTR